MFVYEGHQVKVKVLEGKRSKIPISYSRNTKRRVDIRFNNIYLYVYMCVFIVFAAYVHNK